MSHDWQPADLGKRTIQTMRGINVQEVAGQNTKNNEYKVIRETNEKKRHRHTCTVYAYLAPPIVLS